LGILTVVIMLPLSLFLRQRASLEERPRPTYTGGKLDGTNALQALLIVAGLACCVAMSMPQVHIIAYCGDLGYGTARGAEMLSLMLGFGVVSRIIFGFVADRIGGIGTLIIGSLLQCLALLFYIPFDGLISLYIVSAFFGLAQGGIVPSYALIVRDHFPAREAGTRISLVLTSTVLGMALGGWLSGEIFDYTGSYRAAFLHGIAWNLLNLAIAFWLLMGRRSKLAAA
jgi:MFS family permease